MTDVEPETSLWEETFVQNMIRARERAEMSQTELARRVRAEGVPCHQQTVQRIEQRTRSPRLNEAQAITNVLFSGSWNDAIAAADAATLGNELRRRVEALRALNRVNAEEVRAGVNIGAIRVKAVADVLRRYMEAIAAESISPDRLLLRQADRALEEWSWYSEQAEKLYADHVERMTPDGVDQ